MKKENVYNLDRLFSCDFRWICFNCIFAFRDTERERERDLPEREIYQMNKKKPKPPKVFIY